MNQGPNHKKQKKPPKGRRKTEEVKQGAIPNSKLYSSPSFEFGK